MRHAGRGDRAHQREAVKVVTDTTEHVASHHRGADVGARFLDDGGDIAILKRTLDMLYLLRSCRMIGRGGTWRATVLNPARAKVDA